MSTSNLGVTDRDDVSVLRLRFRYAQHERDLVAGRFSAVRPERNRRRR